jgi:hypothetical protein
MNSYQVVPIGWVESPLTRRRRRHGRAVRARPTRGWSSSPVSPTGYVTLTPELKSWC